MLRPRVLVVFVWTAALLIGFGSESGAQTVSNVSLTSDKSSPQVIGTSITWTAVPSGGVTPYQYKWWIYNGVAWTSPTGWTTSNAYVWTPTGPDPFLVAVWVKSAGNPNDTYEAGFSTPFTITVDASRTLLFDRFAGPNGTLLTSHSPDVNQSHGVWTVPNAVVPVLQGQQLVPGQPDTATYVNGALIDAGAANGVVGVDWTGATSDTYWGVPFGGIRFRSTDCSNGFIAAYNDNGPLTLYRLVGGARALFGAAFVPSPVGRTQRLDVTLDGPTIKVYSDGVLKIQATDTFVTVQAVQPDMMSVPCRE